VLQSVEEGSVAVVIISGPELILLGRLAHAGLAVLEHRDGATEGYRIVAAEVCRRAETERRRLEREARRSKRVSATKSAPRSFPAPPSGSTSAWLSTSEASAMYGVSKQYLRRLASQKTVATVTGRAGEYSFDPNSLAAWAARRAQTTDAH
jgi:hypothetical protein